jgi:ornithine cyclodeaminase/alanine dehydrogenase-like protein (mu-crystallin family)
MTNACSQSLLIDRATVSGLMRPADYLVAVKSAFLAGHRNEAHAPAPMHIQAIGGGFHAKGAFFVAERKVVVVKLNGNFPGNPVRCGLPTIQGAILLCDGDDGRLLAILDSIEITLRRTAAASALAAQFLARPDATTLAILGCGEQASAQVEALAEVLPLRRVLTWDMDQAKAEAICATHQGRTRLAWSVASKLGDATRTADVIVTCTTAQHPFLLPEHVAPGTFVAAIGADSPIKSEIAPELMTSATVVVDSLEQCLHMGDLRNAIAAGAMTADDVHADLGAVVAGDAAGRQRPDELCIFDSTGSALQDAASALLTYERACAAQIGTAFAFA